MKRWWSLLMSLLTCALCQSQGWVGSSSNQTLTAVNSSLQVSPLLVGIGTSSPTQQLHTTQGVRFAGIGQNNSLSRLLVMDVDGNLSWRDAATIGGSSNDSWRLNGNSNTNPGVGIGQNFLGTTDNSRLVIATNMIERMTILPSGQVGIGNINPTAGLLTVGNGTQGLGNQTQQLYTFQLLGQGANAVEHLGMFNNDQSTSRSEVTVSNSSSGRWENNFVSLMVHGENFSYNNRNNYYLDQNNSGYAILNAQSNYVDPPALPISPLKKFAIGIRSDFAPLSFYTNNRERVFIRSNGQIGIHTVNPTAGLHINCNTATGAPPLSGLSNLRIENLPSGKGNYLVVDANGYVFRSNSVSQNSATKTQAESENLSREVEYLKREISTLKALLNEMQLRSNEGNVLKTSNSRLKIIPNPAIGIFGINYSLESSTKFAQIKIIDSRGAILKNIPIPINGSRLESINLRLPPGHYKFQLYEDNRLTASEIGISVQ